MPDASQSVNRLLSSTGLKRKVSEDPAKSNDIFENVLQNQLGSPKVSGSVQIQTE